MTEQGDIQQRITEAEYAAASGTGDAIITINNYYYREEAKVASGESFDESLPCPYRGLFHFGPHDAALFFGRDIFIEELYQATKNRNLIPVLGASGSGKSSVILAGLVPRLQQEGRWQFTHFRPGSDPFYALAEALVPLYVSEEDSTDRLVQAGKLAQSLTEGTTKLSRVFSAIQRNFPQHRVLLIGDQFEELYTLCNDERVRRQFIDRLLESLTADSCVTWAIAMRADFLGNALTYRPFADVLQNADLKLGAMNREELAEVVEKPAKSLGVGFSGGLVERILDDVEGQPGNLPLLEFALTELWNRRSRQELTHESYEAIGGVEGALAGHADERYKRFTAEEREKVRRIFIQLVRPGEGTEDTRRIAVKGELGGESWLLVKRLADARLVVTSRNAADRETVEVVHEALIRHWRELREWMNRDRVFRAWQERLRSLQKYWEESDRDRGLLLRGAALVEAEEWLEVRSAELISETEFIRLSLGDREKLEQEREARRRRDLRTAWGIAIGSLVAVVISGGLGWMAWERTQQAQSRERLAKIRQLAAQSEWLRDRYPSSFDVGVLLAAEGYNLMVEEKREIVEIDVALRSSLKLLPQHIAHIYHNYIIEAASFSPDGKYVVTASWDKTARITLVESGEEIVRIHHNDWVTAASFSPDGKYVVTASHDETARIISVETEQEIIRIHHHDKILAASFSPDGRYIVTSSYDRTARITSVETGKEIIRIQHDNLVVAASFSSDSRYVVTASADKTARITLVETGQEIARIQHSGVVLAASFSPDDRYVITSSYDRTAHINSIETGKEIARIQHEGPVLTASFSSDGRYVVTASEDETARITSMETGQEIARIRHDRRVRAASFNSDGRYVVTASGDNTARITSMETGQEIARIQHNNSVVAASFSPDDKYVVTASLDETARITSIEKEIARINHDDKIWVASFSPNGKYVVTSSVSSYDPTARITSVETGEEIVRIQHDCGVNTASFSPDGRYVVTATYSCWNARVTSVETGEEITHIKHDREVNTASFSPDSEYIVTASDDNTVRITSIETGEEIVRIQHDREVNTASFSPDSEYIVTASDDNTVRITSIETGEEIVRIQHDRKVNTASFSPDSEYIVTASDDNTVRITSIETGEEIVRIQHDRKVNTALFSPDSEYIVTASDDNTARIISVKREEEISRINHEGIVYITSFSADNKYILTASYDWIARIISVETGEVISRIEHDNWIIAASFSPDGKFVLTASRDGIVRISYAKSALLWQEVCSRISRNLTATEWERHIDANLLAYRRTCPDRPVHESVPRRALQWVEQDQRKALKLLQHVARLDADADLNPDTKEHDRNPKAVIQQILKQQNQ